MSNRATTTTRAFTLRCRGQRHQDLRGATAYNYAVNNAGRIKTLTIGTTLRATWTYDGFQKLRIKAATSPAATTHYVWDSFGHIIAEHNATGGAALKQYIWLGDTPLAVFDRHHALLRPPRPSRPPGRHDQRGGADHRMASQIRPVRQPRGRHRLAREQPAPAGAMVPDRGRAGYNWHRTYDPTLGRYTQADPLGFVDGPSVYGYARRSPVMKVDPDGRLSGRTDVGRPHSPMASLFPPPICTAPDGTVRLNATAIGS